MLTVVDAGPAVVVCGTCRLSAKKREDAAGVRGGAVLLDAMRAVQAADARYAGIAVQTMPCLFACSEHVVVHLRAPGKVGYVLGRFAADMDAAQAILDYALHHAASGEGKVPYKHWPEGVKGHFIVRVPPAGMVVVGE